MLPQVVYYVTAALSLGLDRPPVFAVPTGNFGDVFAGYVATKLGLPVRRLLVATNVNDILWRTLSAGDHSLAGVTPTMSPSMDIQVSSNFERLLFDLYKRDPRKIASMMAQLKENRKFEISKDALQQASDLFAAERVDEAETLAMIGQVYRETEYLIDPHTAVGVAAYRRFKAAQGSNFRGPGVMLSTAHPAKFPDAVERATGVRPPLPEEMADLYEREERYDVLPADVQAVKDYILGKRR